MIKGLVSTSATKSYLSSLSRVWEWIYYQGVEISFGRTREQEMQTGLPRDGRRIKEATRIPGSSSIPSAHMAASSFSWGCVTFFQQSSFLSPSQQNPSRRSRHYIRTTPELKSMPNQAVLRSDYEMGSNQSMWPSLNVDWWCLWEMILWERNWVRHAVWLTSSIFGCHTRHLLKTTNFNHIPRHSVMTHVP